MHINAALELLTPLFSSDLFHDDVGASSAEALTQDYAILDTIGKLCEKRKKSLKPVILKVTETVGTPNKNGGHILEVNGATAKRVPKQSKTPEDAPLRHLLESKKIDLNDAYDVIKTFTLNPSKLESLVSLGHLLQKDIDKLKKKSVSLSVVIDKKAKTEMEELVS